MSSFSDVTRLTDVSELDETKRGHLNSLLRKVLNQYKCFAKGKFKSVSGASYLLVVQCELAVGEVRPNQDDNHDNTVKKSQ